MVEDQNWHTRAHDRPRIRLIAFLAAGMVMLVTACSAPTEVTAEIPNCVVGSLKTVSHGTPPVDGTPEWDAMTFSTPREAAVSMFDEYREAGRVDGQEIEAAEIGVIDELNYFVPNPDDAERGEALFVVEQVGDRFVVLRMEFCEGARPTTAIEEADLGS